MSRANELYTIVHNKRENYREYLIRKKTKGFRPIDNPSDALKTVQREILDNILKFLPVHPTVHGFIEGRSIYTHASKHVKKVCVIRLDIKDFFPTCKKEKIIKILSNYVRTPNAIGELVCYKGRLPQGAPTSPCMSNIICYELDKKLFNLAKKFKATYTRYADDFYFSSKKNKRLDKIIPKAHSFVMKQGFDINYKKIRVMRRGGRQVVTGLTVNDKVNVPRPRVKNFRAEVHQTEVDGSKEDWLELQKLKGFNSFIMGANRRKGIYYLKKILELEK